MDKIVSLIGPLDAQRLKAAWEKIGVPDELPSVKYAANARSRNAERAKLLMDLHERTMVDVDPMTGLPKFKTDYLVEEAHIAVGLGSPERYQPTPQERQQALMAKAQAYMEEQGGGAGGGGGDKRPGAQASNGKTRDSEGKPRGRREKAGRRDSSRGRNRGAPVGTTGAKQ